MAKLKCYSCPECGSFLNVDRDQDTFDCPFCGSHYDVVDFHGTDLLEQAEQALRKGDYSVARQNYEYLLENKPDDLELLYNYACAVGETSSLDKYEDPKKLSIKLQLLFKNDPRYSTGPAAPYFTKLAELFEISKRHAELKAKYNKLRETSEEGLKKIDREEGSFGCGVAGYAVIHYFFGAIIIGQTGGSTSPGGMAFYIGFPIVAIIFAALVNKSISAKKDPQLSEKRKKFTDMKVQADEVMKEVEALEQSYERAFKALPELKSKAGVMDISEARANILEPAKKPYTNIPSRSPFSKRDPKIVAAEMKKPVVCKKCGADLRQDKEHKLYVCDHCGVTYDYDMFIGDPITKAKSCIKNGDFESADKWFAKVIADEPSNFEANRGRILCAGKWVGFIQIKLNKKLADVDWDAVKVRLDEAISNTVELKTDYFVEAMELIETAHDYYETCRKIEDGVSDEERAELNDMKESLALYFNDKYREFQDYDRMQRVQVDKVISNMTGNMLVHRLRIIAAGHWQSIYRISPDVPISSGRLSIIKKVISDAIANSSDGFNEYFKQWDKFITELDAYSRYKAGLKKLEDHEAMLKEKTAKNEYSDGWSDISVKINRYKEQEYKFSSFNDTYNKLIELDNRLFYLKTEKHKDNSDESIEE